MDARVKALMMLIALSVVQTQSFWDGILSPAKIAKWGEKIATSERSDCIEMDTGLPGNDINNESSDVNFARGSGKRDSYQGCQMLCKSTGGCNFFTWQSRNNNCFLKSSDAGRTTDEGSISGTKNCGIVDCEWNEFGDWGLCNQTCGGGTQFRERDVKVAAQNGGNECIGDDKEERACNVHNCAVNCEFHEWEQWTDCSESCNGGIRLRKRGIKVAAAHGGSECDGDKNQEETCNNQICPAVHCEWADWIVGDCSAKCGVGTRTNTRVKRIEEADGGTCDGQTMEIENCQISECPIHCEWDDWVLGQCSKSCGGGMLTQTRQVKVDAQHGGNECPGVDTVDVSCNVDECPVNGGWTSYGSYGSCSATCGGGTKTKNRYCTSPPAAYGGNDCNGSSVKGTGCNTGRCPCFEWNTRWWIGTAPTNPAYTECGLQTCRSCPGFGGITYTIRNLKHCSSTSFGSYATFELAKFACSEKSNCRGVYDNSCNNQGTFSLCYASHDLATSSASCVYEKRKGYELVGEKKECGGSEYDAGRFASIQECASVCKNRASMFIFGTNSFNKDRCNGDRECKCYCETSASSAGTCSTKGHDGYRLYKFVSSACTFVPVSSCPGNADLNECHNGMNHNDLCEADHTLPDGNSNFNINNCGAYDVFKCDKA